MNFKTLHHPFQSLFSPLWVIFWLFSITNSCINIAPNSTLQNTTFTIHGKLKPSPLSTRCPNKAIFKSIKTFTHSANVINLSLLSLWRSRFAGKIKYKTSMVPHSSQKLFCFLIDGWRLHLSHSFFSSDLSSCWWTIWPRYFNSGNPLARLMVKPAALTLECYPLIVTCVIFPFPFDQKDWSLWKPMMPFYMQSIYKYKEAPYFCSLDH